MSLFLNPALLKGAGIFYTFCQSVWNDFLKPLKTNSLASHSEGQAV